MSEEMMKEPVSLMGEQQSVAVAGAEGTSPSIGAEAVTGEPTERATLSNSFLDQVPEEFRSEASLANIKDMSSLVKGYVHAQKELGARIRIPGPDASPEARAEFMKRMEQSGFVQAPDLADPSQREELFKKLGRPDSPEGYDAMIPEELMPMVSEEQLKGYRELAHKVGLSKEQAKALLEFDISRSIDTMQHQRESAKQVLQKEWGTAFDARLSLAKEGLAQFEGAFPQEVAAIRNGSAGNNPVVLAMAAELARMYKESGIVVGKRSVDFGMTPTEAKARIQEVMANTSHAYHNDSDPNHRKAVEEVGKLYEAAYSS